MADVNDLVAIARGEIGTEEDAAHSNRGESIRKYQAATSLGGQGWPWCAAFVDWCVQQWAAQGGFAFAEVPRTASAFGLITWANDNHLQVFGPNEGDPDPLPGDIVVYNFSHTGIVSKVGDDTYSFYAIEGNTNPQGGRDGYEVAERGRDYTLVRKFIRLL